MAQTREAKTLDVSGTIQYGIPSGDPDGSISIPIYLLALERKYIYDSEVASTRTRSNSVNEWPG